MNFWDEPNFFDGHRVIEASAGTGKTYSLVRLVVSIIERGLATIDQVLVVTYTDKAAGELRQRLLEAVKERLDAVHNETESEECSRRQLLLQHSSDNFELSSIFTIHSFCQRVLQQYAFENRQTGESVLIDERDVYKSVLKEIQRREWPKWFGSGLSDILFLARYPDKIQGDSIWEQSVLSMAARFVPEAGDCLLPKASMSSFSDGSFTENVYSVLMAAADNVCRILNVAGGQEALIAGLGELNVKKNMFKIEEITQKILLPFLNWAKIKKSDKGLAVILEFRDTCWSSWIRSNRFNNSEKCDLLPEENEWNKSGNNLEYCCPLLIELSKIMEQCKTGFLNFMSSFPVHFKIVNINRIKELAVNYKIHGGYQSYQDMLTRVWDALNNAKGENSLLATLQQRYRYALIDEFQDTDSLQWDIFRTIFVEDDIHKIILIGDPKQAIYRFRGADVHAYSKAKNLLRANDPQCERSLQKNWRAESRMIEGLNMTFVEGELFKGYQDLQYTQIRPPDYNPRIGLLKDTTGRAPLTAMTIKETDVNPGSARADFSRFIVKEIKHLLAGPAMQIKISGGWRGLRLDDICILIRSRGEASYLEKQMIQQNIPYTFYKQPGIWQSAAAMNLNYLFKALAFPADKSLVKSSLLTVFFNVGPQDLDDYSITPVRRASETLLTGWMELAAERNWSGLFQELLEGSQVRKRAMHKPDGERVITNYTHLIQAMELWAHSENLDVRGLSDWLDRKYRNVISSGEEEYHRSETESPKVRLMTMHAAKGLEFPVVFILGGISQKARSPEYLQYYENERVCYNLNIDDSEKLEMHTKEIGMEERQLLYVALTRAQYKLYIPKFIKHNKGDGNIDAKCGFVSRLLHEALEKAWPSENCNQIIRHITLDGNEIKTDTDANSLPSWEPYQPQLIKLDYDNSHDEDNKPSVESESTEDRFPITPKGLWPRQIIMSSFSSMHHKKLKNTAEGNSPEGKTLTRTHFGDSAPRESDEDAGQDVSEYVDEGEMEEYSQLPPGERTGSMLHEVLEEIDYKTVKVCNKWEDLLDNAQALELIHDKMKKFRFYKHVEDLAAAYHKVTAKIVYNTLTTPLNDSGLKLCDLEKECRIHEMEFWYPYPSDNDLNPITNTGIRYDTRGYLNGFMDLVFKHNDKYYLLDWKSNTLKDGYGQQAMDKGMEKSNYRLQYRIYLLALKRWLTQCGQKADIGGVYYLFLRGMTGKAGSPGIYFDMEMDESISEKIVKAAVGEKWA